MPFHVIDGKERPIAFALRTIKNSKRRYSQIKREAAGVIFGLKRFDKFMFGERLIFTMVIFR